MKTGIELINEERQRQISVEGWTAEHDASHNKGEIAKAAICYARPESSRRYVRGFFESTLSGWPWNMKWWKPTPNDRVRELVKAGALIAAEIDRLQNL